ncbi:MAG TPA: flagellar motor stator protein MotA [Acidobacteriaceae bacterium]|jgi:chemotaxis protein MotA
MIAFVGIVIVLGSVFGGFLMEHGRLPVLFQPSEFITIAGAALGTVLVANPVHVLKGIASGLSDVVRGEAFGKPRYIESLKMLYELFSRTRKDGMAAIEFDIEEPERSALFSKYPEFLKDVHGTAFVCDTMRMVVTGGVKAFDLDQMMELDLEVHHHTLMAPAQALVSMADALPGLGIVAAVLGIVVTMGALGGPPAEIGHKVAAALVGTFLGILLCYGMVGPLAANMAKLTEERHAYYCALRTTMLAFVKGTAPIMAVEIGRRAIPEHVRPSFIELETACREKEPIPIEAAA